MERSSRNGEWYIMRQVDVLADLIYEFSRVVSKQWKDVFRENGLSPAPLAILRQVYQEPGLTLSEIGRRTATAKSHVSRTIDTLSRQGFVEKRADPSDQRVIRIHPTAVVATGLDPLRNEIRTRLAERLEALPDEKIAELISAVRTLEAAIRPASDPDSGGAVKGGC